MRKKLKKIGTLIFTLAIMVTNTANVFAASEMKMEPSVTLTDANTVKFTGLSELGLNESIEYDIIDKNGEPATIGIECTNISTKASWKEWKVWYVGGAINAEFYMKVSNNKVVDVYDDRIIIIGGTFSDDSLTKTSKYGKLTFTATTYAGIASGKCWLKGTVTGTNNDVEASWAM